jgi:hypothetical protein
MRFFRDDRDQSSLFCSRPVPAGHAKLHPSTASILGIKEDGSLSIIYLAGGSDCAVPVILSETTPEAAIALTSTQQYNLHCKEGTKVSIRRFIPPLDDEPFNLVDIDLEVSLLLPGTTKTNLQNDFSDNKEERRVKTFVLDANKISQLFLKSYLGLVVAKNEACVFPLAAFLENRPHDGNQNFAETPAAAADDVTTSASDEAQLVLRIRACNTLDEDAAADTVGYHCYRGIITPDTAMYTTEAASDTPLLELIHTHLRPPPGANEHLINITTNDGEYFPVHRKLLRPCIALTKAVRSPGAGVTAAVDIDTLTFDRVLIWLESHVLNKPLPSFAIHLVPNLKEAAEKLQLGSLVEWCEKRLGDSASRRKWHTYKEIENRNNGINGGGDTASKECLLIMDGMVFDVTLWLSEHPGEFFDPFHLYNVLLLFKVVESSH